MIIDNYRSYNRGSKRYTIYEGCEVELRTSENLSTYREQVEQTLTRTNMGISEWMMPRFNTEGWKAVITSIKNTRLTKLRFEGEDREDKHLWHPVLFKPLHEMAEYFAEGSSLKKIQGGGSWCTIKKLNFLIDRTQFLASSDLEALRYCYKNRKMPRKAYTKNWDVILNSSSSTDTSRFTEPSAEYTNMIHQYVGSSRQTGQRSISLMNFLTQLVQRRTGITYSPSSGIIKYKGYPVAVVPYRVAVEIRPYPLENGEDWRAKLRLIITRHNNVIITHNRVVRSLGVTRHFNDSIVLYMDRDPITGGTIVTISKATPDTPGGIVLRYRFLSRRGIEQVILPPYLGEPLEDYANLVKEASEAYTPNTTRI